MNRDEYFQQIRQDLVEIGTLPEPAQKTIKGKTFYLQRLNGHGRTRLQERTEQLRALGQKLSDADWAAVALCAPSGEPVFDVVAEGAAFIAGLDGDIQTELAKAALQANGFYPEESIEVDEKKS